MEIKKLIPFKTALKTIKYFRINLTKEAKDLYSENCKTALFSLLKEIKDTYKWKPCVDGLEKVNIVKITVLHKLPRDSFQPLSKSQCNFCKNRKTHPKIHGETH